ncbi:hypothetical protein JFL43_16920 [Viridibacillus sp. YIM B01967]|uniref:Receptor n=1 Tax=Viridibacillus soli TaxID=2798301 RepID=A0ABS1HAP2_9BACL|nr:hypothetical protein [Viridibacillus soli]MBK3496509.1 hypothetical protein [Viridibacillus soli]
MLSEICLVIAMLALGSMLLAAVSGLLKDGLKGLKRNGKWAGISLVIYVIAFAVFLITQ